MTALNPDDGETVQLTDDENSLLADAKERFADQVNGVSIAIIGYAFYWADSDSRLSMLKVMGYKDYGGDIIENAVAFTFDTYRTLRETDWVRTIEEIVWRGIENYEREHA